MNTRGNIYTAQGVLVVPETPPVSRKEFEAAEQGLREFERELREKSEKTLDTPQRPMVRCPQSRQGPSIIRRSKVPG